MNKNEKISKALKGRKLTEEHKEKLKGRIPWNKGISHTNEIKEKISKICKGKNKGIPKSEEHRRKIGEGRKGKLHTEESKIKCGLQNKGKKLTEEHKRKIVHFGPDNPSWKGGYDKRGIAHYNKYSQELEIGEEIRRNNKDENILEVKCNYCGKWFIPNTRSVWDRIRCLNGNTYGECRLYCSEDCKKECSIFNQTLYPKGFKKSSSREVQPELRKMRFEIDNYTCRKCGATESLHCHHLEGIRWEPLESADVDKCITYCKACHLEVHQKEDCGFQDMKCNEMLEKSGH
jgi:hypothetical protein